MNAPSVQVTVRIMDKEYVVACPETERAALMQSAELLNERMRQARDEAKVVGSERLAVITALNIVHDLIQSRETLDRQQARMAGNVKRLEEKISAVVSRPVPQEGLD